MGNTKRTATAPRPDAPEATEAPEGVHVIAEGDTLASVAEKHGTTVAALQRINAIKTPDLIWVGMTLHTR